jgi:hypothetical protein
LERLLDTTAQFHSPTTCEPQPAPAASDKQVGGQTSTKAPNKTPAVVHAAMPRSSLTADDDADAGSGTSRKNVGHLPIAYPIETVPEITGIPRTKIFEAVRAKNLTARKVGRSTIIERVELERFIKALPIKGRVPDELANRTGGNAK